MKIKIGLERTIFSFVLFYPLMHILIATFLPDLSSKIILLFLFIILCYFIKHTSKRRFIFVCSFLCIYVFYNFFNYHLFQVKHSDFYTFVLLALIFAVYSQRKIIDKFYNYMLNKERIFLIEEIIFFLVLLYTIVWDNGLKVDFGSKMPVLFGPYEVPHMLGYMLIILYCLNAFFQRMSKKKVFVILKILCTILVIWTAARSAVLGLSIIIFADFILTKNINRKFIILGISVIGFLYLVLFTDVIIDNPLMQKTLSAMDNGSITNGREMFSGIAMRYYNENTNFIEKILGIGMNNVRNLFLHTSTIRVAIHAHNDYVNALVGYGAVGLGLYIWGQLMQVKVLRDWKMKILIQFFIFILAYYNGFAMYAMFTPCLIVIYVFMNQQQYLEKPESVLKAK